MKAIRFLRYAMVLGVVALLGAQGTAMAVTPGDPDRTCESANGSFIDKTGDGNSDVFDWREMDNEEKRSQIIWNLETLCKEAEPALVEGIINAMNRLAGIEEEYETKKETAGDAG